MPIIMHDRSSILCALPQDLLKFFESLVMQERFSDKVYIISHALVITNSALALIQTN